MVRNGDCRWLVADHQASIPGCARHVVSGWWPPLFNAEDPCIQPLDPAHIPKSPTFDTTLLRAFLV